MSPRARLAALAGLALFVLVGAYCRGHLGVPLVVAGIVLAVGHFRGGRLVRPGPRQLALAANVGYLAWLGAGALGFRVGALWIELVVLAGGVALFAAARGAGGALLLVYHLIGSAIALPGTWRFPFGSDAHRVVLTHLLLRATAITLVLVALLAERATARAPEAT